MLRGLRRRLEQALAPPAFGGARWTARRLANFYHARWEEARNKVELRSRPVKLTVEATSACNLRCPACFTGVGEVGRPRGGMSLECFRRLLDELGPYLFEIEFYNWGEPLLYKPIFTMIEETTARGIGSTVSTNFSFPWDRERADRLVGAGLTVLGVSIDGARQETYEQYRAGGKLEQVLANCRLMADAKARARSPIRLVWEYHVFAHNVGDVDAARALASDLGMEFIPTKGWTVGEEWDPESPYRFFWYPSPPTRCRFLWQQAVVNNDGGVAPCCGTFYREDDMGSVAAGPGDAAPPRFAEVWNGERFRAARRFYRRYEAHGDEASHICYACPMTRAWDAWGRHRAAGGDVATFDPGYTTNDHFNFFFNRRPARPLRREQAG